MKNRRDIDEDRNTVTGQCALPLQSVGTVWLAWTAIGLRRIDFADGHAPLDGVRIYQRPPAPYAPLLREYDRGGDVDPASLAVDPVGTAFQRTVWAALRRIPRGRVRTYGGIAADVGNPRATRAVGTANGRNPLPIVIPCHRVVGAGHALGGYTGGLARKRALLELEGVALDGDLVRPGQLALFD